MKISAGEAKRLVFRNLFIDNEDVKIGKIVEQYFKAVALTWPDAWDTDEPGIMLNRTNGFRALMRLFGPVYTSFGAPGGLIPAERYLELFKRVKVKSGYFTVETFKPGTSGEAELRRFLYAAIFEQHVRPT